MTAAEARELCRALFLETLPALRVEPKLRQVVRVRDGILPDKFLEVCGDPYPLARFRDIRVLAFGKAAVGMAATLGGILEEARNNSNQRGVVVSAALPSAKERLPAFEYFAGGHPYPNEESSRAAEAALALLYSLSETSLALFLVSGGGSALLEKPLGPAVSLDDLRSFHRLLVGCGASIWETNVLRKHFSAVKGGRLAARAFPATQITLYVSDVPEGMASTVASGPTLPDESTLDDCRRILAHYALREKLPASYRALLDGRQLTETPKPAHPCFARSRSYGLLSNRDAVDTLVKLAQAKGLVVEADWSCDDWDYRQAADYLLARLAALRRAHPGRPVALVSGGELSCPVTGDGLGGRNQAFVLECVPKIAGQPVAVLSAGTDGIDGNSPACGALADGDTAARAAQRGLLPQDFQQRSDSFRFFDRLGDALLTGPTGTNVRDLRLLLAYG